MRLYLRFTLSFRDVEDLLAERGLDVSYETVRRWVLKFGPLFAKELRRDVIGPPRTDGVDAPPDGIAMCQGGDVCRIPRNEEGIHERS